MNDKLPNNTGKLLIYQNEKGDTKIDVYFVDGDIWMTQKALTELYQVSKSSISEHIKNIFDDGELTESETTVRKFRTVQMEGERKVEREFLHYNFQMILAIGYRVRSRVGIHFRNWATSVLTKYTKKGFALNDDRLKNPKQFGADYFDELLERIRDIRSSENE
ncbi:virulence RhuM family protein [Phocaeicola barnesiae]|uniref:virulence RhuM family protein n=1 Tax=Phocaeicola barnesiae TaxID=376804 RepID=UPI001D81FA78|nr:RhuM family protein [Phocaeicola barnesiae]HJG78555.1 virulence RhuM family protein [Phocaeicola barnesiae]